MNKATAFKLSMLTLMFGGTVSCNLQSVDGTNRVGSQSQQDKIEPELQRDIATLEDLGAKQDVEQMEEIVIPDYVTPEYIKKIRQQKQSNQR